MVGGEVEVFNAQPPRAAYLTGQRCTALRAPPSAPTVSPWPHSSAAQKANPRQLTYSWFCDFSASRRRNGRAAHPRCRCCPAPPEPFGSAGAAARGTAPAWRAPVPPESPHAAVRCACAAGRGKGMHQRVLDLTRAGALALWLPRSISTCSCLVILPWCNSAVAATGADYPLRQAHPPTHQQRPHRP